MDYKSMHFSSFKKIEEMVNNKEDMLLSLLKEKYFKNCFYQIKNNNNLKSKAKSTIDVIKDNYDSLEM